MAALCLVAFPLRMLLPQNPYAWLARSDQQSDAFTQLAPGDHPQPWKFRWHELHIFTDGPSPDSPVPAASFQSARSVDGKPVMPCRFPSLGPVGALCSCGGGECEYECKWEHRGCGHCWLTDPIVVCGICGTDRIMNAACAGDSGFIISC